MEVIWSEFASNNLLSIFRFIAESSTYYADKVVKEILEIAMLVGVFPESGRIVPEYGLAEYREKFIYQYRIIYRVSPDRVLIIAIVHMRIPIDSIN